MTKASIGKQYRDEGFFALEVVPNDHSTLPHSLASLAINLAGGRYSDVRIIPVSLAVDGEFPPPADSSLHVIYVREDPKHPENMREEGPFVRPLMSYRTTSGRAQLF